MYAVEVYATVRQLVFAGGLSRREVARRLGLSRDTVGKMCRFSEPPGYLRSKPVERPKLGPLTGVIDAILAAGRSAPAKQRHPAKRIWQRLRDEHGFDGGYSTVKDYVRSTRARAQEAFVPLVHPPGHAQVDFGEAAAVIGGETTKVHFFCMDLPHSDAASSRPTRRRPRRRSSTATSRPSASSAGCRSRCCTTTPSWRWRGSCPTARERGRAPSPGWSATTPTRTASGGRARATTGSYGGGRR